MKGFRDSKKITNSSIMKIRTRFFNKVEEYKLKTLEELDKIYENDKISSTDRNALLVAMSEVKKLQQTIKSDVTDDNQIEKE